MDNNNFNNNPNIFGTPEQGEALQNTEPVAQPAGDVYSQPQAAPEAPQMSADVYGQPQAAPETPQMSADVYSQPQGGYDANANMYTQPQGGYDTNANMYTQPQGGYDANANMYTQPQGGYDANANMYTQPQGGYDANANMYTQPQGGYDANANMYTQPQGGYDANANMYTQPQGSYDASNQYAAYNTASTEILDKNGAPAKNNFVMKMVFSILEILTICACNIISCVMGVVGLIFNIKANKAFKQGDSENFHKAKKTSSLMLWIGLGISILGIVILIVVTVATGFYAKKTVQDAFEDGFEDGFNDFEYDYDYDNDYDYDYDEDYDWTDSDYDWDEEYESGDDEQAQEEVIELNDTVVYDCNGVVVYAQTLTYKTDYDGNIYPEIAFEAQNNSGMSIDLSIVSFDINGVEITTYCDSDTIKPGKKVEMTASAYYSTAYRSMNYPEIGYFTVGISCWADEEEVDTDTYYTSVSIADDYQIYIPDANQMIYSGEGLEVYYLGCEDGCMTFYAYYIGERENVILYVNDIAINDYMQDDYVYMNLRSGVGAFGQAWLDSDVDDVQNASAYISAKDYDTWEDFVVTDEIYFIQ